MPPVRWSFTTAAAAPPPACPCSIWSAVRDAAPRPSPDTSAVELGSQVPLATWRVQVTGVRFYKGTGNTGTHLRHLWSGTGTLLGDGDVHRRDRDRLAAGRLSRRRWRSRRTRPTWRPTTRRSVGTPTDAGYFAASGCRQCAVARADRRSDGANGVYRYGTGGGFPTCAYQSSNYWVDVVFTAAP